MAGYSEDFPGYGAGDSHSAVDKREKMLGKLGGLLHGRDRQEMTLTMDQLSLEFYKHAALAENYIHNNEIGGAEGHRLIAEAIHHTLETLEVKRRTIVKVIPSAAAAATTTAATAVTGSAKMEVKEDDV